MTKIHTVRMFELNDQLSDGHIVIISDLLTGLVKIMCHKPYIKKYYSQDEFLNGVSNGTKGDIKLTELIFESYHRWWKVLSK